MLTKPWVATTQACVRSAPRGFAVALVVAAPGARYPWTTTQPGRRHVPYRTGRVHRRSASGREGVAVIMAISISPSPQARQIYNMMVVRSHEGHLTLAQSIALSVTLKRRGDSEVGCAVAELRDAEWITPVPDGGWMVT